MRITSATKLTSGLENPKLNIYVVGMPAAVNELDENGEPVMVESWVDLSRPLSARRKKMQQMNQMLS